VLFELDGHAAGAVAYTVFLVDDVPDMRMLLRLVIEAEADLRVVGEAGDGAVAVEEIGRLKPDVVVLDLSLPGMDGLEAIPLLQEVSPETRIVVFSGYASERMAEAALSRNAARYVEKGSSIEDLAAIVREVAAA
jgi:DNA-binding NarL/FixJ family response regulator